jgi:RNA polymerase sigma factor (sigma-70 family)
MTPLFARQQSPDRAFERLYKAHVQDVYRYALMVLRNREDAEDVVQTTFLKAYRVFARGERPRNARPWLITIAHNTCRTRLRDAKRRPQEVAFEERLAESVEAQPQDGVEPKELLRALGALSFNQRSALVMRELEGRSYSEIAHVLEVSPSAVETLLFRARRAVREQLEGALTCGEAERSLSLDLDGRLPKQGKSHLRAHLRSCGECSSLARRQRARRAALRGFGPLPVPGSIASWGGGTAAGTGIAAKVAAVVAAGAAAVGVGYEAAEAVSEPSPQAVSASAGAAAANPFAQFVAFQSGGRSSSFQPGVSATSRHRLLEDAQLRAFGASPFAPFLWAPGHTPASSQLPSTVASAVAGPVSVLASTVEEVKSPLQVVTNVTNSATPPVAVPQPPPLPVQGPPAPSLPVQAPPAPSVPVPQPPPVPQLPPVPPLAPVPPLPSPAPAQLPSPPPLPVEPPPLPSLLPTPTLPAPPSLP